mmetsp:Transcript_19394/g.44578  ORF Transcript_19394/g.44578 Transcript_19394/m.44578 type:complete len:263 (+) Transcript_19394:255-1043(+)
MAKKSRRVSLHRAAVAISPPFMGMCGVCALSNQDKQVTARCCWSMSHRQFGLKPANANSQHSSIARSRHSRGHAGQRRTPSSLRIAQGCLSTSSGGMELARSSSPGIRLVACKPCNPRRSRPRRGTRSVFATLSHSSSSCSTPSPTWSSVAATMALSAWPVLSSIRSACRPLSWRLSMASFTRCLLSSWRRWCLRSSMQRATDLRHLSKKAPFAHHLCMLCPRLGRLLARPVPLSAAIIEWQDVCVWEGHDTVCRSISCASA